MSGNQILDVNSEEIGKLFGTSFMFGLKLPAKPQEGNRVKIQKQPPDRIDLRYVQQDYKNAVRVDAEGKAFGVNLGLGKVFSHFDFCLYDLSTMHIDHFVPCAEVNKRVDFIVELLNTNSAFAKGFMQVKHGDFPDISMDKFFMEESGKWYSTYYLYVCFYSNILNTQLLPSDVNCKKSDLEIFDFLDKNNRYLLDIFNKWLEDNGKEVRNGLTGPFVVDKTKQGSFIQIGGKTSLYDRVWAIDNSYQHVLGALLLSLENYTKKMPESMLRLDDTTVGNARQIFLNIAQDSLDDSGQKADNFANRLIRLLPVLKYVIDEAAKKGLNTQKDAGTPETVQEAMAVTFCENVMEISQTAEFFKNMIVFCNRNGLDKMAELISKFSDIYALWPAEDAMALHDWFILHVAQSASDTTCLQRAVLEQVQLIINERSKTNQLSVEREIALLQSKDAVEETTTVNPIILSQDYLEEEQATALTPHYNTHPSLVSQSTESQSSNKQSQDIARHRDKRSAHRKLSSSSESSHSSSPSLSA